MSYSRVKTFNAGKSRTGLGTVAYSLDGGSTWLSAGVSESPAGSGIYRATISFADGFTGALSWTTGEGGTSRFGAEEINPGSDEYTDAKISTRQASGVVVTLPDPAPLTYGPVGTGSRVVNQDYPTAGSLSFLSTSSGPGIGGALVRAYLAAEYAANPNTATVRGQTLTLDSGAWANPMDLDPGAYVVTFKAEGYQLLVVDLTVS